VGDSITAGLGVPPGKSYPDQLQGLLGDKWQVKNFGVSARTLLKKGDFPYWNEKAFKDAKDFKPDVVIIMLGTNDTKPQNWAHHDDFYGDYKDLVETFKNLPSNPRIFLCRPTPVPEPGNYGINEANLRVEMPLIDQVATEENAGIIDMHAALAGKPSLFSDRVHPTADGAAVMAQTVAGVLTGTASETP
jgi:lysophospholipase L1-like esterase